MRFVIFTHSLVSDWNHGNAHFLRGIASEMIRRGYDVRIFEPEDGWSRNNLIREQGQDAVNDFHRRYPNLKSILYRAETIDLDEALKGADVVIVHEWNSPSLIGRLGRHRSLQGQYCLLFHDTHHRSLSQPDDIARCDLSGFDGVLAYGNAIRDIYRRNHWSRQAWTWHEAADTHVFRPLPFIEKEGDLVWIGNWGDEERVTALREFLIEPVKELRIRARVYGVRYPPAALRELSLAGIEYGGWLPNYRAPEVFGRYRVTVHIPRSPYVEQLPGIPTIRPFEAMACGIPLVSAPWNDSEHLFRAETDLLYAADGRAMIRCLRQVLSKPGVAADLSRNALQTIRSRHTCRHRMDELLVINRRAAELSSARGAA